MSHPHIFSLNKGKKGNNKENKTKEEEDIQTDVSITAEIISMNFSENLNYVVEGIKINNVLVENYEQYQKKINKIIANYKESYKEFDYRLSKLPQDSMKIDSESNNSEISKFKKIGKIGFEDTFLNKDSSYGNLEMNYDKLKIEALGNFTSVRANNCVFKGKWVYEVTLLSNKISQIGWCTLLTSFRNNQGVGDDSTSYAYDGYRVLKWGISKKEKYGKTWDIGDTVGVCIDLESKVIEYFLNGESLGIAFKNIPVGPNIVYFPAISFSKNEKVFFNFGTQKMLHNYEGYESLDIPKSIYKNLLESTQILLDLLINNILNLLQIKTLEKSLKLAISCQIFNFIANVSIKDTNTFNTNIIPFLLTITNEEFRIFFENIYIYIDNRIEFSNSLMDKITNLIELYSSRGIKSLQKREEMMSIFNKILNIDSIVNYWIEGRRYVDHLKCIISGSYLKTSDINNFLMEKINILHKDEKKNYKKFYFETRSQLEEKIIDSGLNKFDETINKSLIDLYRRFYEDIRTFRVGSKKVSLFIILVEYYSKSIKESSNQNDLINFLQQGQLSLVPNENFIKYFYFNMLELFSGNFNQDLSNFSIEPWFSRLRSESIYYDEIGVGGTISHVTSEYGNCIEEHFKEKKDDLMNYLFNRLINITTSYIIPFLRDYSKSKESESLKDFKLKHYENDESRRASYTHTFFRQHFNIFSIRNQSLLYQFSYFIINWLNNLIKINKNILYFIPKLIMQLPYDIFRFLITIKSPIIKSQELLKNSNLKSVYFTDNKYTLDILFFYCYMFNDTKIANPELKEGFINKISYFLRKKKLLKYFEQNEELLEMLIKGLIQFMTNDTYCHLASENIVKIIKPSCFGQNFENKKGQLIKVVKMFFDNNIQVFHEFMDNYYKLLNKVMTDYTMSLTQAGIPNRSGYDSNDHTLGQIKKMLFYYSHLCDLMKILEFLLAAYPNEFIDTSTINFSRFANFLKNLSSRILDKNYIEKLINLIEKFKPGTSNETFTNMAYSTIGIFINLNENKNMQNYENFIIKLVSPAEFDVEPFYKIIYYLKQTLNSNDKEKYIQVIDSISKYKSTKEAKKKMSEAEWEETVNKENVCIICYANDSDRILIPCHHVCCNECLMQYRIDKQHCFICNALIEDTEINKLMFN